VEINVPINLSINNMKRLLVSIYLYLLIKLFFDQ